MSELKVNAITDASGGNTASINGATPTTDNTMGRNRVINGDMRIDQRNAGASVTANNVYSVDRWIALSDTSGKWAIQQNSGSVTPPVGFTNYLGGVSSSAYSPISSDYFGMQQRIEGFNVADFGWGTSNAKTVTLSFWVRSSLTGTFGGSLMNSAQNRSYPFPYTISSADTWEYKTITISGDTTGTWNTNSSAGIFVFFSLGAGSSRVGTANAWTGTANVFAPSGSVDVVGTSGATFYITGVQLEAGSVATSFERRHYGQELILARRYYQRQGIGADWDGASTSFYGGSIELSPAMRATPSATLTFGDTTSNINTSFNAGLGYAPINYTADYFGWQIQGATAARAYTWSTFNFSAEL